MKIIRSSKAMASYADACRRKGLRIGLVPTMGYLHEGHLSLVRVARKASDRVVVSLFVNPMQFGPKEDLSRYPRDEKADAAKLRRERVDVLFIPPDRAMYPEGFRTHVEVEGLGEVLCGAFRPGHFRGVTTVVAKLFNLTDPFLAVFGQKDAQQALLIRRMVKDLNLRVKVVVAPLVREPDGLAMSSRNVYLSPEERRQALGLSRGLGKSLALAKSGERDAGKLVKVMRDAVRACAPAAEVDYIAIVDPESLAPVRRLEREALALMAVRIGRTRLIDNLPVKIRR